MCSRPCAPVMRCMAGCCGSHPWSCAAARIRRTPSRKAGACLQAIPCPAPRGPGGMGGGFRDPFDIFREVFGQQGGGGGGIFEEMFGGGARRQGGGRDGDDLRYDLEITLEEAARGIEKEISFRKNITCE